MVGIPTPPPGTEAPEQQEDRVYETIPAQDEYHTPTILNVEVEEIKLREIKPEIRQKWNIRATHEFNIRFRVLDGKYARRLVFGSVKADWYPKPSCKLRNWAMEILGVDTFPEEYAFDSDHLLGQRCRVTIRNYTRADGSTGESVQDVWRATPATLAAGTPAGIIQPQAPAAPAGIQQAFTEPPAEQPQWMPGNNPVLQPREDEEPFNPGQWT